jgi:hypothetical protein
VRRILLALLVASLAFAICGPALAQKRELPPFPARELHWKPDEPFADKFITDGATIRLIKDEGVTVAVFGYLEDKYIVAEVTVMNDTEKRVTVRPEDFVIVFRDKGDKYGHIFSLPPAQVAKNVRGRAKWGNFFRALAAGMASTTSTSQTSGTASIYGSGGYASGTYNSTTITTAPNVAAQRAAVERNRLESERAAEAAEQVLSNSLWANTLFPKTYASGLVYFERKKFETSDLFIVIDGTAYSFLFGGTRK